MASTAAEHDSPAPDRERTDVEQALLGGTTYRSLTEQRLSPAEERLNVLAPIVRGRKGEFKKELAALRQKGFTKVRIDGQMHSLDEDLGLDRRRNHSIEVVVDRLLMKHGIERRLAESIEIALNRGDTFSLR